MGTILYDENACWDFGYLHIAIWSSFTSEVYTWEEKPKNNKERMNLWLNISPEHIDIISTEDRKVEAILENWKKITIYKDWIFQL